MMKNFKIILFMLFAMNMLLSCQEDVPELSKLMAVDELDYQITQNPQDPNMVIMESFTPGVIPLWSTPMGRSTRVKDTVRLAFSGHYKFVYSVQGAGGLVSADTVELDITTTNLSYVDDPLWNTLTGGVGESKTWLLDLNAEGISKFWDGPMYFFGTDNGWQEACMVEGGDCWNYKPDWPGNMWVATVGDYDEMTFSLIDGANLAANHSMIPSRGEENGSFFLDANSHTLTTSDVTVLHTPDYEDCVGDWTKARVFSLTEDAMQLGFLRKESCDGAALLVYNYISKEYSDNWVPEAEGDPEPPYDGDANSDLTTDVSNTKTWIINLNYPYNWHDLGGTPLNEVATYGDDPEGFTFSTWVPPYEEAAFSAVSLQLTKGGANDGTYVFENASGTIEGNYSIDESNEIDFGQPLEFFSGVGGWLNFGTTADNTLRIIDAESSGGTVTGIWLGQKATDKDEYFSIHLKNVAGAGGGTDPGQVVKDILTANPWKIDSDRTYSVATSYGTEQGPVIFTDYETFSFTPLPGEHYAAGEAGIDYGTVQFKADGTVSVTQRKRVYTYVDEDSGETLIRNGMPQDGDILDVNDEVTTNGIYVINLDADKLTLSIDMLHPWTCDYAVADWGALTIYKIEEEALLLQALRDPDLSGEDAFLMKYVFVPAE